MTEKQTKFTPQRYLNLDDYAKWVADIKIGDVSSTQISLAKLNPIFYLFCLILIDQMSFAKPNSLMGEFNDTLNKITELCVCKK